MRIFLDTEFIEDGRTIEPLSIGMVREDDKEYYVEVASNKRLEPNEWVLKNVMMDLPNRWPKYCLDIRQEMKVQGITKSQIISRIGEGEDEEGHNALTGARYHKKIYSTLLDLT